VGEGFVKEKSPREIKKAAQHCARAPQQISQRNIFVVHTTTLVLKCDSERRCNTFASLKA
jgi:hypothetical protein